MIRKTVFLFGVLAVLLIILWFGTALFLASYKAFRLPDQSMEPAFRVNERVLVDRKAYEHATPQRGDVIIFKLTAQGRTGLHCKRVVGLPGETLEIKDRELLINGQTVEIQGRPDVPPGAELISDSAKARAVLVPQGSYYVLGDSPKNSFDSRYFGPVFLNEVRGKVITSRRGKPPFRKIGRLIRTPWVS